MAHLTSISNKLAAPGRNITVNGDMQIAQRYPYPLTGLGATSGIHTLDECLLKVLTLLVDLL